ncbi:MAG: hypothetical protein EBZ75_15995, partial [Oxalobacteraceae bacterium]|nr:hypothetical protein [Oxalobacteraceae bacterium]
MPTEGRHQGVADGYGRCAVNRKLRGDLPVRSLTARIKPEQWLILCAQGVEMVGGLLFFKLLTVYLPKAEMGNYLLATSVMALVLLASFSVMDQGLMRFASIYEARGDLREMYSACLFGYAMLALVLALAFLCLSVLFGIDSRWGGVFLGLMCWILTEPIKNAALAMSNAVRNRMVIAKAKALDQFARAGLVLVVALLVSVNSRAVLMLLALSGVCVGSFLLWSQRDLLGEVQKQNIRKVFADVFSFSWPLFIWGIFGWLQQMSNRWLLEAFSSEQDIANFGVLASLSTLPFTMVLSIVAAYALPIIYQAENANPGSARQKVSVILRRLAPMLI